MKLQLTKYENAPEYGTWGEWTLGKEHGTFGRSIKGMWASIDGSYFIGVESYEQDITERFKLDVIGWRELNRKFKRMAI